MAPLVFPRARRVVRYARRDTLSVRDSVAVCVPFDNVPSQTRRLN